MPSYTLRFHARPPSRRPLNNSASPPPMHRSISAPPPPSTSRPRPPPSAAAHHPPTAATKTPSTISMDSDDSPDHPLQSHRLKALNLSTDSRPQPLPYVPTSKSIEQVDLSPISSSYTSSPSQSSTSSRQLTPPQPAESLLIDSSPIPNLDRQRQPRARPIPKNHHNRPLSPHNRSQRLSNAPLDSHSPDSRTVVIRTRHSDLPGAPHPETRSPSSPRQNLYIPTGKVPHLPPRPNTPVRPHTPQRLPRPRVFIGPSPRRQNRTASISSDERPVSREPSSPQSALSAPISFPQPRSEPDDNFYFSEDDGSDDETLGDTMKDMLSIASPSDVLSNRVRRAVGALRSISFQTHTVEDLDTAWGQTGVQDFQLQNQRNIPPVSLRWRRPRGRISSRNGVQEFERYSDIEERSSRSYGSGSSVALPRGTRSHGSEGGNHGSGAAKNRQKGSLWGGMRREKSHHHSAAAAQLLVCNQNSSGRYLAAALPNSETGPTSTSVVLHYKSEYPDRAVNGRGTSGDKYVDFIHASAQRESSRQKLVPMKLPGIVNKAQSVFRRNRK